MGVLWIGFRLHVSVHVRMMLGRQMLRGDEVNMQFVRSPAGVVATMAMIAVVVVVVVVVEMPGVISVVLQIDPREF